MTFSRVDIVARRPPKTAAEYLPQRRSLPSVREAAKECKGCELWTTGRQTVFGEGTQKAEVMLVGEQPGDAEDLSGRPFVGPAGQLLDRALARPVAIVCLGATAAQAILGRAFKVTAQRGELMVSPLAPVVVATVHPSSILRAPDDETRRTEMKRFTEDLRKVVRALSSGKRKVGPGLDSRTDNSEF